MDPDDAERALAAREAELAEREQQATQSPADPVLLEKLAQERDALADERDDLADTRDEAALQRREHAVGRDVAAAARDRRRRAATDDADPGFRDRFLSGRDVDAAAGDRADALNDERHALQDRGRAREGRSRAAADRAAASVASDDAASESAALRRGLESRTVIGQAQGLLMAQFGIDPEEAFSLLVRESQRRNVKLRELAALVVDRDPSVGPFD